MTVVNRWTALIMMLLSAFLLSSSSGQEISSEASMLRVFTNLNIQPEQYMLHYGGRISLKGKDEKDPLTVIRHFDGLFDSVTHKQERDGDRIRYSSFGKVGPNLELETILIQDCGDVTHPYLSVKLKGNGIPAVHMSRIRTQLFAILYTVVGGIPDMHLSVQGSTDLDLSRYPSLITDVMQQLNAKEVESMRTENTTSISAYSPQLTGGINTKGGRMNVQIATRKNEEAHRVMVTLGTPIITIEY